MFGAVIVLIFNRTFVRAVCTTPPQSQCCKAFSGVDAAHPAAHQLMEFY